MPKPIIRIHNTEIDEVVDREMTVAELKQYEADQEKAKARLAEYEALVATKAVAQAKLAALGLTIEDLTALGL